MFNDQQKKHLEAPLDATRVKRREGFDYIEGWRAIAEANRIFGFDGWTREMVSLDQTNCDLLDITPQKKQWRVGYVARVRVVACGVTREGVGYGSGMAKPDALGSAIESASKEAETDAMKRALMTFGNPFGLALYDKKKANVAAPSPLSDPASTKRAIKDAMEAAGIEKAHMKPAVDAWILTLGAADLADTTVEQRAEFIESTKRGEVTSQKAES